MGFAPGDHVDVFRFDRTIERGRYVSVFAATDTVADTAATVTVVTAHDAFTVDRLSDRLQAAATLPPHAEIAAVNRWGRLEDGCWYSTDPLDGVRLADLLRRLLAGSSMPLNDALHVLTDVATGIDIAHSHGITHGALSPQTVVVRMSRPRHAVVTDLVVAEPADGYQSPERDPGKPAAAGDVYSFGRLAHSLLTAGTEHEAAVDGEQTAGRQKLLNAVRGPLAEATAADPAQRPTSCTDVVSAVHTAMTGAALEPVAAPGDNHQVLAIPNAPIGPWHRRPRGAAVVAAVAALVVIGAGVAITALRSGNGDADTTPPVTITLPATMPPPSTAQTTTSTTVTTTTTSTTTTTTTIPLGAYGLRVGAPVTAATGPETAYALAVRQRGDPAQVAAPGSSAFLYLQWLRMAEPSTPPQPVTAAAVGLDVVADRPVTLTDFVVDDSGHVSTFSECVNGATCAPIDTSLQRPDQTCQPSTGCPHLRSRSGDFIAYLRATLTNRWPDQVLLFELVPTSPATATVTAIDEPNGRVHYDPATRYFVAVLPGQPAAGTRDDLTVTLSDGSTDYITIGYNG